MLKVPSAAGCTWRERVNATDAEPELVPPVPLAAAPAGPGPEFAPMPAPAAAPMAAPAPAPAPAKTSGLWSWLPWFLSPSSLACQNMPKSACLNFTVVICHSFSCQLQKMDARHQLLQKLVESCKSFSKAAFGITSLAFQCTLQLHWPRSRIWMKLSLHQLQSESPRKTPPSHQLQC